MLHDSLQLLGLTTEARTQDVKNAYRRLAQVNHPDLGGDVELFSLLNASYQEALAYAQRVPCPFCQCGYTIVVGRSFSTIKLPCEKCGGTGLRG